MAKGEMRTGWFFNRDKEPRYLLAQRRKPGRVRQLPDPDVLAQEIVEDLEAALEQFRKIANDIAGRRK
jgi:hypothetical protein